MNRRLINKHWSRLRRQRRHAEKVRSCDPHRLWPLDSVQRQDFEIAHCGDFTRVLKWHYGGRDAFLGQPNFSEQLLYSQSPAFELLRSAALVAVPTAGAAAHADVVAGTADGAAERVLTWAADSSEQPSA